MTTLPPGVHPQDRRSPTTPVVPTPTPAGEAPRTRPPFSVPPGRAMGVFQRASGDFSLNRFTINPTSGTGGVVRAAPRTRGRVSVTVWVPSTASHGVVVAEDQGKAQLHSGAVLNVGDSITISTEAPVYVGLITGQTTGTFQVLELNNPETR